MASWKDPPYGSDEYETLCENSKPSDFYFDVRKADDDDVFGALCHIYIVPKEYFANEDALWDQSMYLKHILPDDLGECMESVWDTDRRGVEEVRKDLLARGFEENARFSESITRDYE